MIGVANIANSAVVQQAATAATTHLPNATAEPSWTVIIGAVVTILTTIAGLVYKASRTLKTDAREDTAGNMQQSVFSQMNAALESMRTLLEQERAHSAKLLDQMNEQRGLWEQERKHLNAELASAHIRAESLNSELTRVADQVRTLSDRIAVLQSQANQNQTDHNSKG